VIVLEDPASPGTATPTAPALPLPLEKVALLRPGPGSQVTSPIFVLGRAGPTWNNEVDLRLVGEDGRVVAEASSVLYANPGNAGLFSARLSFETPLVAEAARLEVHNYSRRDGQLDHIGSVELILLSVGEARVHPALRGAERLALLEPREGQVIEGGALRLLGAGWVDSDQPLTVQVLDRQGEVVGETEVEIESAGTGQAGWFEAQVSYQVEIEQSGRVVVFERGDAIPGVVHYASQPIVLRP
jgi:hypothetical protein